MTDRLYYRDPTIREFTAEIVNQREQDGQFHVVLNQTAFYPEGGGQPADDGTLGGIEVRDVYQEDGEIYHVLADRPPRGLQIKGKIDWDRRFDHMQQHTGQHLLSAVLDNNYQARTVGFHLGDERVTIDIDKELTDRDLEDVEEMVNQLIYENIGVEIKFPEKENLQDYQLRKEPVVEEDIRLVIIKGIDVSPCGGTHLQATGQLGQLKIIGHSSYKQGLRITFVCGNRALQDYRFKNRLMLRARDLLSVQDEEIPGEIERLLEEKEAAEKELSDLQHRLLDYRAEEVISQAEEVNGIGLIQESFPEMNYQDVRLLAKKIISGENRVVIMGQSGDTSARLILGRSDNLKQLDMNQLIKEPLALLDGGGGGNRQLAQGGGSRLEQLQPALSLAREKIKNELTGE